MTKVIYMVKVRGLLPESIPRKVIEAHAGALKSKALAHPRHGKDVAKSEPELAVLESGGNEDISGEYRL
jgi:hypothetical protein